MDQLENRCWETLDSGFHCAFGLVRASTALHQSFTRYRPCCMNPAGGRAYGSAARENMIAADIQVGQTGMMRNGIEQCRIQSLREAPDEAIRTSCKTFPRFRRAAFHMDDGFPEFRDGILDGLEHALC